MGQPTLAVAIPTATPLLSARTGAFAKAVAAAATATKLMDHHIAGTPTCHAFPDQRRPFDRRGRARRSESATAISMLGPGGLSIIRLKQEKCNET
jgi:hypothetical protein